MLFICKLIISSCSYGAYEVRSLRGITALAMQMLNNKVQVEVPDIQPVICVNITVLHKCRYTLPESFTTLTHHVMMKQSKPNPTV